MNCSSKIHWRLSMHLFIKKCKSMLISIYVNTRYALLAGACYIFRLYKINDKKIVFSSFNGKSYGDSPAAISEYFRINFTDYEIVWLLNKEIKIDLPNRIKRVDNDTFAAMKELSTAKYWVDSHLKFWWHRKRKKQVYIQTYHGCIALKKVDADMPGEIDINVIKRDRYNASIIDYYVSNSEFCDNMFRSALLYTGNILRIGCPRNDLFFRKEDSIKLRVKEELGIDSNRNVLLYAPTFRDNGKLDAYNIDYSRLLDALNKNSVWGNAHWCIVVRLHPILAKRVSISKDNNSNIVDGTFYYNMQELEQTSDIIISDYSSCIFDALIMNKVGLLYASDYSTYMKERGMYWNYFDLPFPVSQTNDELYNNICGFDMDEYIKKMDRFKKSIKLVDDGNATEKLSLMISKGVI